MLGVITHYLALFVITLVAGLALIAPAVFRHKIGNAVGVTDYFRLARRYGSRCSGPPLRPTATVTVSTATVPAPVTYCICHQSFPGAGL